MDKNVIAHKLEKYIQMGIIHHHLFSLGQILTYCSSDSLL